VTLDASSAAVTHRAANGSEAITHTPSLRECVTGAVRRYLADLDNCDPDDLYEVVLHEVESPLIEEVMRHYGGNQSRAAAALGINRATLRKKLRLHQLG
jgi:Fis family transcriptional regulator, factor for inversion stimulation protein